MSVEITIRGVNFKSGDEVTVIYTQDGVIEHGAIWFDEENTYSYWFCSNSVSFKGDPSPNKLGYKYSWLFNTNTNIESAIIYHKIKVEKYKRYSEYIDTNLQLFIRREIPNLTFLFEIKNNLIENYDNLTKATENGIVTFHSSIRNKKLDIKFGRLIRRISNAFAEIVASNPKNTIPYTITDEVIEKIHNRIVSDNNNSLSCEIVSGRDIIKGYTRSNYCEGRGTLHNSCMTDKHDFLKLYTDNPDKISLAIFNDSDNKICGRALIWNCDDGITRFDRIYYTIDWQHNFIEKSLKDLNYQPVHNSRTATSVKLSKIDFTAYPYMDTLYGISFKKKQLFYDPHGNKKIRFELRTTTGQIFERYSDNDLDFE